MDYRGLGNGGQIGRIKSLVRHVIYGMVAESITDVATTMLFTSDAESGTKI